VHWEQLSRVLACSDSTLRQVVRRWPGIGDLSVVDVMQRMLCLKVLARVSFGSALCDVLSTGCSCLVTGGHGWCNAESSSANASCIRLED
jgi:hypothetical protein